MSEISCDKCSNRWVVGHCHDVILRPIWRATGDSGRHKALLALADMCASHAKPEPSAFKKALDECPAIGHCSDGDLLRARRFMWNAGVKASEEIYADNRIDKRERIQTLHEGSEDE